MVRTRREGVANAVSGFKRIDIGEIGGFGIAHFVLCPILDDIIGMSLYRVLDDRGRRI